VTAEDLAARRGLDSEVYEPAEDSRLLAEAATERVGPGDRVLDVGTGSGYVGATVARTGATVHACDLNPHACRRARETGLSVVRGSLTEPFRSGAFDRVLFNPPYLPTPPELERGDWMERALSGGPDGRRVVEPFLDGVGRVLAPSLTGLDAVGARAATNGLGTREVAEASFPYERLVVLSLTRGAAPGESQ
jgi:release factor glutamine methyltransferase